MTSSADVKFTTQIMPLRQSDITFNLSAAPLHPYDSPTLTIRPSETKDALDQASHYLNETTQPVAFPTETVYGLGADARKTESVRSIYAAKKRPADNPLIVHIGSLTQLRHLLRTSPTQNDKDLIPAIYHPLINKFWPGALTIVLPLPKPSPISTLVTAGQSTFAVRLPSHPLALALLLHSDCPLAAPSANASTRPSPTLASHVHTDLGSRIPFILDGGASNVGVESTVVNGLVSPPVVLRPGGVSVEEIKTVGGVWGDVVVHRPGRKDLEGVPQAPGMKYRHYSPSARVVLFENVPVTDIVRILDTPAKENVKNKKVGVMRTRTWSAPGAETALRELGASEVLDRSLGTDGEDISRGLFAVLRELDGEGCDMIFVEGVGEEDEGLAIMNRLRKAASETVVQA
ncbi:SUA5/yciO/yrdC family protein [Saitoella complicata NRRL Y-17804]|nr:SUA5/yciO/yrdC family protein [Saitoella complicata NRRL Y-17804]ODQ56594.1 SUA5/yciO/yrdC family protein [Saitoella complicata NRRL Y-17804]